jgi:peptidoglycan/LPS O-acetylase OafA/YrhL
MKSPPAWLPPSLRQLTSLQLTWAVLAALWIALVGAWQWPLLAPADPSIVTFLPVAALYFGVAALGIGGLLALTGREREPTVESKNIERISRLDHLRFFAAALVIFYHYFGKVVPPDPHRRNLLSNLMMEGNSGVDVFFVLSGFVFGLIGYEKRIRYFDFIWSRVVRIYPLYLLAIVLVLASHAEKFLPMDSVLLMFPVFIVNYLVALPGFGQLWTVGLEFQFYLLFPFLAAFLLRNGYRYLLAVLVVAIGLRGLYYMELGTVKNFAYGSLPGRIDQFVAGIGAAWLYLRHRAFFAHPLHLLLAAVLAAGTFEWLTAWDGLGAGAGSPLWIVWPTISGVIWAYFALSYASCRIPLPAFVNQSLARLGALTFSLYVMHDFAVVWSLKHARSLALTGDGDTDVALQAVLIALPLSVGIAWCTFHLVEKQFFIFRRKYVEPAPPVPSS